MSLNPKSPNILGCFLVLTLFLGGCHIFSDSFETASDLDRKGLREQALKAYQDYLKNHPQTELKAVIYSRMAAMDISGSQYDEAISWYEKIDSEFPGTDEDLRGLLKMADLYRNQLKDQNKAVEYSKKALDMCFSDAQIHNAVQTVISSQLSSATTLFYQKKYKDSGELVRALVEAYPAALVAPEQRARVEALQDRIRREALIENCDSTALWIKSETVFNNSFTADFVPSPTGAESGLLSPDGQILVSRKKAKNGIYYLYSAKVLPNSNEVSFKLLPQTFGAELPTWSADSQSLVYERLAGKKRKLEKTNLNKNITKTLYFTASTPIPTLGFHPAFHPAGNKIAFVWDRKIWVMTADGLNVTWLKTAQHFDYTSELSWSFDGTMIRCQQGGTNPVDDLLILDATTSNP